MSKLPLLIFMYFFEGLIVYTYAKSIFEKRNKSSGYIFVLFYTSLMLIYGYIANVELVNMLLTIICNVACVFICFKSSVKSAFFHGISLSIIQYISEAVTVYLIAYITKTPNTSYEESKTIFFTEVVFSKILYFVITRLIARISNKENSAKSWGRWASLSVLPASSFLMLLAFRKLTNGMLFDLFDNVLCIAAIGCLLFANIFVYIIYESSERSNQKLIELEMTKRKNDADISYLSLLEKKNEQMNIISHDFKNHINLIKSMNSIEDVKEYAENMLGELKHSDQLASTKNKILDVILGKYMDICAQKGIELDIETRTENLLFMEINDISALMNNLLDNAVESAEKSEEKRISLKIARVNESFKTVSVRNSCDTAPISRNGRLMTAKSNKQAHGYGTRSIERVAEKYNGICRWSYDGDKKEFCYEIVLNS